MDEIYIELLSYYFNTTTPKAKKELKEKIKNDSLYQACWEELKNKMSKPEIATARLEANSIENILVRIHEEDLVH